MELIAFLGKVVLISLSGVMAPGPVTAVAIAMGTRNRHAGALIAIGHGVVEFPLIAVITLGMGTVLGSTKAKTGIGLAGGIFLLLMAAQMLLGLRSQRQEQVKTGRGSPVVAGVLLSAGNPYFLFWWATVGLSLATTAKGLGIWAFALFAIVHWLCDLLWVWALSWASFSGSVLLGPRRQRTVLVICSVALSVFGVLFISGAIRNLAGLIAG